MEMRGGVEPPLHRLANCRLSTWLPHHLAGAEGLEPANLRFWRPLLYHLSYTPIWLLFLFYELFQHRGGIPHELEEVLLAERRVSRTEAARRVDSGAFPQVLNSLLNLRF